MSNVHKCNPYVNGETEVYVTAINILAVEFLRTMKRLMYISHSNRLRTFWTRYLVKRSSNKGSSFIFLIY